MAANTTESYYFLIKWFAAIRTILVSYYESFG